MNSLTDLILLSLGVFFCSVLPGLIPVWIGSSRHTLRGVKYLTAIDAIAAGLFMGTAVSVIIPEGIHFILDANSSTELPKLFGLSINLGFAFMLVIDRIPFGDDSKKKQNGETLSLSGSTSDHKHHSHSTFIGLLVHSAADGVAMGAVSLSHESSVEFVVFFALILHKGPASFTLVSHLMQQNQRRSSVIRNLILFSAAAPVAAISTFILFSDKNDALSKERVGGLMLFSAGTFLFVAVMHILPETLKQENNVSVPWTTIAAVIFGMILPSFLNADHSHSNGVQPILDSQDNPFHNNEIIHQH